MVAESEGIVGLTETAEEQNGRLLTTWRKSCPMASSVPTEEVGSLPVSLC